jgi:hypothetical protein
MIRFLRISLSTLVGFVFLFTTFKVFSTPSFEIQDQAFYNTDVYSQLTYLKKEIELGADKDMQSVFPEGFIFLNAVYGLAWCELAKDMNPDSDEFRVASEEAIASFEKLNSNRARTIFKEDLNPDYGIFYQGWKNYLLAHIISSGLTNDEKYFDLFRSQSEIIVEAFGSSETYFLQSYPQMTWPADNLVAIASVSIYNSYTDERYSDFLKSWQSNLPSHLDKNGLIPHSTNYLTDEVIEGSRGSSQSLIMILLKEIDRDLAERHFSKYKELFLTSRFGLPMIREYPQNLSGSGDIDSGPVILGIGSVASITAIKAFNVHSGYSTALGLSNTMEIIGIPTITDQGKQYLFGKMPMADAFLAWVNASLKPELSLQNDNGFYKWQCRFMSYLIVLTALLLLLINWSVLKRIRPSVPAGSGSESSPVPR